MSPSRLRESLSILIGRDWVAYLLIVIVCWAWVTQLMPFGAAISSDSLTYLATAKNIAEGLGISTPSYDLASSDPRPVTTWPPLYPALLAPLFLVHAGESINVAASIIFFNGFLLALTVGLIYHFLRNSLDYSFFTAIALSLLLIMLTPISVVYIYVWSETLFIPIIFAAFYAAVAYTNARQARSEWLFLILSIFLISVATYTRYVGILFFLAFESSILLVAVKKLSTRIHHAIGSSVAFMLLIAPMLYRNLTISGQLTGPDRGAPPLGLEMDVVRLAQYANADLWQIPEIFSWMLLAIISISIGVLIARRSEVFSRRDVFLIFEIALIWVVTYLVGLLAARSMQNIDLDTRMLSVVVPLVLVIPVALFSLAPQGLGKSLLGISVALWAGFQVYHGVERIGTIKESWEKHGAPGNVNLLFYNSVTSPAFDIFRVFRRLVTPDVEDLVLTDYRDVRVVGYFSGRATTVRFPSPDVIGEEGVRLEAKGRVFLVIRDPRNWEAITGLFGGVGVKELARVEGTPSGRIGEFVGHGER